MREMVDDYTKQLELRDETIHRLETVPPKGAMKLENNLRQEIEELTFENRRLKEQARDLNREQKGTALLKDEIDRLKRTITDKDRYIDR